jgi:hypothetical protein
MVRAIRPPRRSSGFAVCRLKVEARRSATIGVDDEVKSASLMARSSVGRLRRSHPNSWPNVFVEISIIFAMTPNGAG